MIEEDIVLLFSGNKQFVNLVETFDLSIDYGVNTSKESTDNEENTEDSITDMGSTCGIHHSDDEADAPKEEEADSAIHGVQNDKGISGAYSQDNKSGASCYSIAFPSCHRGTDGAVLRPKS